MCLATYAVQTHDLGVGEPRFIKENYVSFSRRKIGMKRYNGIADSSFEWMVLDVIDE